MDWDRKYIHFCIESYQSAQDVGMACGIELSTWAARDLPWQQSGNKYGTMPHPERDLGYSFTTLPVTCPICRKWMEQNLNKCVDCGEIAQYTWCNECATKSLIADGILTKDGRCILPSKRVVRQNNILWNWIKKLW